MTRGAGAALHRKPGGLVQHHDVGILVQDHVLQRLKRLRRRFREMSCGLGHIEFQRRNPNALALLQPILAVRALAVHAQLAFADDALDVGERQAGKARLEKAVDAHVVLIRCHDNGLNFFRQRRWLGDGLLGLHNERSRLLSARHRKARRLAARTMTRLALTLDPGGLRRIPIGTRTLRAIARRAGFCQRSLDATAHDDFPLLSFAQYSSRFRISRSKPRSGGS